MGKRERETKLRYEMEKYQILRIHSRLITFPAVHTLNYSYLEREKSAFGLIASPSILFFLFNTFSFFTRQIWEVNDSRNSYLRKKSHILFLKDLTVFAFSLVHSYWITLLWKGISQRYSRSFLTPIIHIYIFKIQTTKGISLRYRPMFFNSTYLFYVFFLSVFVSVCLSVFLAGHSTHWSTWQKVSYASTGLDFAGFGHDVMMSEFVENSNKNYYYVHVSIKDKIMVLLIWQ